MRRRRAMPISADTPRVSVRRPSRILYLPVEVKARELQAKSWLADAAAAAGFSVVIGSSWNIQLQGGADLPPGVVLFKTLNHLDAANMRRFKAAGHVIAALDEEAFGRSTDETTLRLNVHPDALGEADLVMVQGAAQRDLMARVFPEAADKIVVTGSPRADVFAQGLVHAEARMREPPGLCVDLPDERQRQRRRTKLRGLRRDDIGPRRHCARVCPGPVLCRAVSAGDRF